MEAQQFPELDFLQSDGWRHAGPAEPQPHQRRLSYLCDLPIHFYDLHQYNDIGGIFKIDELKMLSEQTGKPILLGEFGQNNDYDDNIKKTITRNFLTNAWSNRFMGAIAWILNKENDKNTYYKDGSPRAAVDIIKQFPRQLITA